MAKVIIEAAINGNRPRADNPHIPTTASEIAEAAAACHAAGASIVHIHSRDPATGETTPTDAKNYAGAIRAIRARCPALIWPSCPEGAEPARVRFKHLIDLAADPSTKPDLGIADMGSMNIVTTRNGKVGNYVYTNTIELLTELCGLLDELGYRRSRLQMFDSNSIRNVLAFVRQGILREPLAVTLYFGAGDMAFGMPPSAASLAAYVDMLKPVRTVWFASVIGGDVLELAPAAIAAGGHLRVGLEDHAYREQGCPTNTDLVRRAAAIVTSLGHEVASVDDARRMLDI